VSSINLACVRQRSSSFKSWCSEHDFDPLSPGPRTVAAYLAALEPSCGPSTTGRTASSYQNMRRPINELFDVNAKR
jgi:hypothetical protein